MYVTNNLGLTIQNKEDYNISTYVFQIQSNLPVIGHSNLKGTKKLANWIGQEDTSVEMKDDESFNSRPDDKAVESK